MNLYYVDKEIINRLCNKSKEVTNSKWRWRKIVYKTGCSLEEIEKQLDIALEQKRLFLEKMKGLIKNGKQKDRQYSDVGKSRNDGQEERSRETNDESVTTGGSK